MLNGLKLSALLAALFFATSAFAGPIKITLNPEDPGSLGDWDLDPFHIQSSPRAVNSFTTDSGNTIRMRPGVTVMNPDWWSGHGLMYGVHGNRVVLRPINPLGAISFVIDSAWGGGGSAWVNAGWTHGPRRGVARSGTFRLHPDGVGVGIHATGGACITSVVIDPPRWGFGQIQTADCVTSVPEPGSLSLLALGLLGLGFFVRRRPTIA